MNCYAPDIKLAVEGNRVNVSLKVLTNSEPKKRSDWQWIDLSVRILSGDNLHTVSPDLRVCVFPVLESSS